MGQLGFYLELGFNHVLDLKALDHLLFLIVLTLPFSYVRWKDLLITVSIFTIGHTISLILVYFEWIPGSTSWVEFLIALSIGVVATRNLMIDKKFKQPQKRKGFLNIVTLIFGIIHGLGFGGYFRQVVATDQSVISLVGFAFGIEASQILIVGLILGLNFLVYRILKIREHIWILIGSGLVLIPVFRMILKTWPGF